MRVAFSRVLVSFGRIESFMRRGANIQKLISRKMENGRKRRSKDRKGRKGEERGGKGEGGGAY